MIDPARHARALLARLAVKRAVKASIPGLVLALVLGLVLGLAACSGDAPPAATASANPTVGSDASDQGSCAWSARLDCGPRF